ncbi:cysteinyl-tRNA synthetase [Tilletia horrida]|uniref:cysteine--tRNA ligase n=1 Tax=Tilletia horrida TaxID=155126 RepID=A0AAN6GRI1_9BASI|nr:cysteinyl-tRNA synthetase [Tilletia horrida]KAK0568993.1 cysteinyl-tRNA synthetase [Tilletia horrida]
MASSNTQQPAWVLPTQRQPTPVIQVYNSLTRSKTPLVPRTPGNLTWYNCGPTVYDASHMGHARNYVSQDVLRRILRDYFGFNIHLVMNITDIDDKIIVRARHRYLLARFRKEHANKPVSQELVDTVRAAWSSFFAANMQSLAPPAAPLDDGEPLTPRQVEEAQWESISRLRSSDPEWVKTTSEKQPKFGMWFTALDTSRQALMPAVISLAHGDNASSSSSAAAGEDANQTSTILIDSSADILAPYLDAQHGSGISNPSIFRSLAAHWERSFFKDMARLRVERPTTLTRVSEYVPEIVAFTQKIIKKGFAYEDERGNVWFDTRKFDGGKPAPLEADEKAEVRDGEDGEWEHSYAKLAPWSKGNRELIEEGEGSLSTSTATTSGKRQASDFALWKSSKAGEPAWPSPWGPGRPGWHIECSVMGSDVLGTQMDIHSGGEDLCFPHHDNELAQSEAAFGCRQWVNYFIHTGHLHIEGLKMSKSLKNFITIEEALSKYSARQLRLAFLNTAWNARMDFGKNSMAAVASAEQTFNNFFGSINAMVREAAAREVEEASRAEIEAASLEATSDANTASSSASASTSNRGPHGYNEAESELMAALSQAQTAFHRAMADSFDTPAGLSVLLELVSKANVYERSRKSRADVNLGVLQAVGGWVGKMLRMWGLGEGRVREREGEVGWGTAPEIGKDSEGESAGAGEVDREALLAPYLRVLSTFRDSVRSLARSAAAAPSDPNNKPPYPSQLLALADRLRDFDLAELGVSLEDQDDGKALVKFVPAAQLRAAREEKERAALEKEERKKAAKEAQLKAQREALLQGATPPSELFRSKETCGEVFTGWDEKGVPTLDEEGKELSKKRRKNAEKKWEKQIELHAKYLKAKEAGEI